MRKFLALAGLAVTLSACAAAGGINTPRVISGSPEGFIVYDANTIEPKSAQKMADLFCSNTQQSAEFVDRGGETQECVSKQLNYCATYRCK